jgi:hypothetical protein
MGSDAALGAFTNHPLDLGVYSSRYFASSQKDQRDGYQLDTRRLWHLKGVRRVAGNQAHDPAR